MSQTQSHDVLYRVSEWTDDKAMPRTVSVDGDGDLEAELKDRLAGRHEVEANDIELIAF